MIADCVKPSSFPRKEEVLVNIQKEENMDELKKTYNIRVRVDYVGYYQVEAKNLQEAEWLARTRFDEEVNDQVQGVEDISEFDPNEI